jgi:hypothetical protein
MSHLLTTPQAVSLYLHIRHSFNRAILACEIQNNDR